MKFNKLVNQIDEAKSYYDKTWPKSDALYGLTINRFLAAWDASSQKKKMVKKWGLDITRKDLSMDFFNDTAGNDRYELSTELDTKPERGGYKEEDQVFIEFTYKNGIIKITDCRVEGH
jgi:hypothetical protein